MQKTKHLLLLLLVVLTLLASCGKTGLSFTPGTYQGAGEGHNGPVAVAVTVDSNSIRSIEITAHNETKGLADNALKLVPQAIIKSQSLAVDSVSGATMASDAIKAAVAEALSGSGVDMALLNSEGPEVNLPEIAMTPGVYTGTAYGKWAEGSNEGARFGSPKVIEPISVDVTVDETSIVSIKVTNCDDTAGFVEPSIERMEKEIVAQQSIGVDVVSGCTMTCRGILSAVSTALEQAGADLTAFNIPTKKINAEEEYTVKVAVIGAGTSGTAAALAACETSGDILIIERTGKVGGMGGCSTGFIGIDSSFTRAAGSDVTVDDVFREMMEYSDWTANPLLVRTILEKSGDTADWLAENGYNYSRLGGYGYTHDTGKGFEKMDNLYADHILPSGAELLLETSATELIMDGKDVVGVKAVRDDGTRVTVHADAVVIATGGFGGSPEMLERYTGSSNYFLSGMSSNTGDGLNMALAAGASPSEEISPHLTEFAASTSQDYNSYFLKYLNYGGLLQVNLEGKRFMDEGLCAEQPLAKGASAIRTAGSFYVIIDRPTLETLHTEGFPGLFPAETTARLKKEILWRGRALVPFTSIMDELKNAMDAGIAFEGDSIETLESQMGIDQGVLVATIDRYRDMIARQRDDDFLKDPVWLTKTIEEGPYYAIRMEPAIFGTLGGIKVNERLQVINTELKPINGLYAAGQDTGGFYGYPYYDIPGCTMAYAYNSGRIAGENAVTFAAGQQ